MITGKMVNPEWTMVDPKTGTLLVTKQIQIHKKTIKKYGYEFNIASSLNHENKMMTNLAHAKTSCSK
jgi:DNA-directed RNA polymerase specialized sigma54-like protein